MKPQYLTLFTLLAVGATKPPETTFETPRGPASIAHSHNDFAQDRPLDLALELGYSSIEVDVTDRRNDIAVVHLGFTTYGTLREMYLDPLQKRVNEKGSVYGDGKKFHLWIEMRDMLTGKAVVPLLTNLLARYPMFSIRSKDGRIIRHGPVDAILINSHAQEFFEGKETAPACLGLGGVDTTRTPNREFECWNYLRWEKFFTWEGEGKMPATEVERLRFLQSSAHRRGLRTRFWDAPDTAEFWREAKNLPFDKIGTDRLKETMEILRESEKLRAKLGDRKDAKEIETRRL